MKLTRAILVLLSGIIMTGVALGAVLYTLTIPTTFQLTPNHSLVLKDVPGNTITSYAWNNGNPILRGTTYTMLHNTVARHDLWYMGDALSVDVTWNYTGPTGVVINIQVGAYPWAINTVKTIAQASGGYLQLAAIEFTAGSTTPASETPQTVNIKFYIVG